MPRSKCSKQVPTGSEPPRPVLLVEALGSFVRKVVVAFGHQRPTDDDLSARA